MEFENTITPYATINKFKLIIDPINFDNELISSKDINLYENESLNNFELKVTLKNINESDLSLVTNSLKAVKFVLIMKSTQSMFRESKDFVKNEQNYEYVLNLDKNIFRGKLEIQALVVRKNSIKDSKINLAFEKGCVLGHSDIYNIYFDEKSLNKKGKTPIKWVDFNNIDEIKNVYSKELFWNTTGKIKNKKLPMIYLNNNFNEHIKDIIKTKAISGKKAIARDMSYQIIANNFLSENLTRALYRLDSERTQEERFPEWDNLQDWEKDILETFLTSLMQIQDKENAKQTLLDQIKDDKIDTIIQKASLAIQKHLKTNKNIIKISKLLERDQES